MKLHEYQAKEILRARGLPVAPFHAADSIPAVEAAVAALGRFPLVLKAQVHAGGRGKAGGVRLVRSREEAVEFARGLLGRRLVTKQSGPEGKPVDRLLVAVAEEIERELYFGVVLDRKAGAPVAIACAEGGVEIEEVARRDPAKILRAPFSADEGLEPWQGRLVARRLGFSGEAVVRFASVACGLARAFLDLDATLAEVNPLGVLRDGSISLVDAKIDLEDNALFRHPDLAGLRDVRQEDAQETEAAKAKLSYIHLDGTIGCLVNGAGLAMATMDIIKLHGGEPANFLDVGGGASAEQVTQAFRILLSDARVKAILVNIFGGIMKCDTIAGGILEAVRAVGLQVPLVVRLEGTRVEEGRRLLRESGLPLLAADGLAEAARKAVEAAGRAA